MSDTDKPTRTEREYVLAQREAFCIWRDDASHRQGAVDLFPLPKTTRPRVVRDGSHQWRVVNGELEWNTAYGDTWKAVGATTCDAPLAGSILCPTPKRVALWADLIANPTEEVDE